MSLCLCPRTLLVTHHPPRSCFICSNDRLPVAIGLAVDFDCEPAVEESEPIANPGYRAPMAVMNRPWANDMKILRSTYDVRAETVAEKPVFRTAWKKRKFCVIPALGFFGPNYESGRPVRRQI